MKSYSGDRELTFRGSDDEPHFDEDAGEDITKANRSAPQKWLAGKKFAPTLLFNGKHPDIAFSKLYKLVQGSLEGKIKLNPESYSITIEVEDTFEDEEDEKDPVAISAEIEVELHETVEDKNIYVAEFSLVKGDFFLFSNILNDIKVAYVKK
jgi:hypothetical protein